MRNLEQQRTSLQHKIEATGQELRKVQQNSKAEQRRLALVKQQVEQRRQIINVIEEEMSALQHLIDSLGGQIVQMRAEEQHLLDQYSRSVRALQRRNSDADRLLFLFSSKSFDEAMLRQRFLGSYAIATSQAASRIKDTRARIEQTQAEVNASHQQKGELLALRDSERKNLEIEAGKRSAEVKNLKTQERQLAQNLDQQRKQALQLDNQIQAQIAAEIRAAEEKAQREREARERRKREQAERRKAKAQQPPTTESSSTTTSSTSKPPTTASRPDDQEAEDDNDDRRPAVSGGYAMNAQERKLSGSFTQNKGRLPLPVRGRYDLVRRFGLQQHSTHSRVQVNNGGIDLRVYSDHRAYAVFSGVVSRIFMTPGFGQSIIVRHGNYLTVYSNLSNVNVSPGAQISTGQAIGTISPSGDAQRANVLHFQLWKERTKLNPEQWVKR